MKAFLNNLIPEQIFDHCDKHELEEVIYQGKKYDFSFSKVRINKDFEALVVRVSMKNNVWIRYNRTPSNYYEKFTLQNIIKAVNNIQRGVNLW